MIKLNSPVYIKTSLAAAMSLGLEHGIFKSGVRLTGLNLLLTYEDGCRGKCAYCGITGSKTGETEKKKFIRVRWPVCSLDIVLENLKERQNGFERICISMITHNRALKDTVLIIEKIKRFSNLPVSVLVAPTIINTPQDLESLKNAGAEMAGVAIDAATEEIFDKYRGRMVAGPHKWIKYWEVLKWSLDIFGRFKAGVHLISGLGETEEEMLSTIYRAHNLGAKTHLFSFYPEKNTILSDRNPPDLISYRKIQIARYMINEMDSDLSVFIFDPAGKITGFTQDIRMLLTDGAAFMTSGCPCAGSSISACNRPFANERPSEDFRNYPHLPDEKEKLKIKKQLREFFPV